MPVVALTGAPGAGKTALVAELAARGHVTIRESASDVAVARLAAGDPEPWRRSDYPERIAALQVARRREATRGPGAALVVADRSEICTLALARYLGHPVGPVLATALDELAAERPYGDRVLVVEQLGRIERTAVRRMSLGAAGDFGRLHESVYAELGYGLVAVAPVALAERADAVEALLTRRV